MLHVNNHIYFYFNQLVKKQAVRYLVKMATSILGYFYGCLNYKVTDPKMRQHVMRYLSIIACWHLNYDKISVKRGVGLIKVVSVQKIQIVSLIIHKFDRRFIVTAKNARKKIRFCQYLWSIF